MLPGRADTKKYGGVKDPMRTDLEDANIIAQLSTPRETLPPSSDEAELASMFCRCWFPRKINPLYWRRSKLALRTVRTAITLQKLYTQRRAHSLVDVLPNTKIPQLVPYRVAAPKLEGRF